MFRQNQNANKMDDIAASIVMLATITIGIVIWNAIPAILGMLLTIGHTIGVFFLSIIFGVFCAYFVLSITNRALLNKLRVVIKEEPLLHSLLDIQVKS